MCPDGAAVARHLAAKPALAPKTQHFSSDLFHGSNQTWTWVQFSQPNPTQPIDEIYSVTRHHNCNVTT